jgi:hypothetical protein
VPFRFLNLVVEIIPNIETSTKHLTTLLSILPQTSIEQLFINKKIQLAVPKESTTLYKSANGRCFIAFYDDAAHEL